MKKEIDAFIKAYRSFYGTNSADQDINALSDQDLQCLLTECIFKGVRALRGYFGPPMRPKNEIRFSLNSSYWFIRTMTQVYKSDMSLTFTVAMGTKMAVKTG